MKPVSASKIHTFIVALQKIKSNTSNFPKLHVRKRKFKFEQVETNYDIGTSKFFLLTTGRPRARCDLIYPPIWSVVYLLWRFISWLIVVFGRSSRPHYSLRPLNIFLDFDRFLGCIWKWVKRLLVNFVMVTVFFILSVSETLLLGATHLAF